MDKADKIMTKWEYCELEILNMPRRLNSQIVYFSDKENEDTDYKIGETIQRLGLDGWEMVTHTKQYISSKEHGILSISSESYIFKRPVE